MEWGGGAWVPCVLALFPLFPCSRPSPLPPPPPDPCPSLILPPLPQFERAFPDKAAPLCVGCQSGKRSMMAANVLAGAGYSALQNVEGGWAGECVCRGGGGGAFVVCCRTLQVVGQRGTDGGKLAGRGGWQHSLCLSHALVMPACLPARLPAAAWSGACLPVEK